MPPIFAGLHLLIFLGFDDLPMDGIFPRVDTARFPAGGVPEICTPPRGGLCGRLGDRLGSHRAGVVP